MLLSSGFRCLLFGVLVVVIMFSPFRDLFLFGLALLFLVRCIKLFYRFVQGL